LRHLSGWVRQGSIDNAVSSATERHVVETRTLAPTASPLLSKPERRRLRVLDFFNSLKSLARASMNSAGFKLQSFGERWPLASLDCMKTRKVEKYFHRIIRVENECVTGCNRCGNKQQNNGKALMKCSQCRVVLYCSAACQKDDWKTHKVHCHRILPSKR
jgi:hypothetical protein